MTVSGEVHGDTGASYRVPSCDESDEVNLESASTLSHYFRWGRHGCKLMGLGAANHGFYPGVPVALGHTGQVDPP